jgi:site-specific DNA recombinase
MAVSKNVTVIPARKHTRKSKDEEKPKLRVAAYCRVSTDSEEQATSYDTQIEHYTAYIQGHPDWVLAGILRMTAFPVPTPRSAKNSTA